MMLLKVSLHRINRNQQNKLYQNQILSVFWSFSRCSRCWGHWGWRDHSSIWSWWDSKSWSDGASHPCLWTISGCCSGLLHPQCTHQSADIFITYRNTHTQYKKSLLYSFVSGFSFFSPFLAGPAPPQKICSKCTEINNKKSAVINNCLKLH